MFAYIYLYLTLFSQFVQNGMLLSMINSDFSRKSFVMLCEECFQISIYFYLRFSQMESRDLLFEYDKLRFLPEIICNAVCGECLQISIYIYNLFSQMVSHGEYDELRYHSEIICNAV